jgi:hypothetical protein
MALPELDTKPASRTRLGKRRKSEHDHKQPSHTRPAKRRKPEHDPKQANQAEPTIEMVKDWDSAKLFKWIQQYRPKLLQGNNLEKFNAAGISGDDFMDLAGNAEFFENKCNITSVTSTRLAKLAEEMAGREVAGIKSKLLPIIPCMPRRLQANNVTEMRKQTEYMGISGLNRASKWNDFYARARALRDEGKKDIDTVEDYNFPTDDQTLDEACKALSNALQDASKAMVVDDNAEVKKAVDNLRKVYDAGKTSTVTIRYIDAGLPPASSSPLGIDIEGPVLAQPWMKELIGGLGDKSFPNRLVVIRNPGIGECLRFVLSLHVFPSLHS